MFKNSDKRTVKNWLVPGIFETYDGHENKILISFLFLLLISCQPRIAKVLAFGDSITQGKVGGQNKGIKLPLLVMGKT